jgi:WD40 repeat protein
MLAKRLTRRGIAFSGGSVAAGLTETASSAGVPASVVTSTIKAASLLATRNTKAAIPVKVIDLTEGVIKAMMITKLKRLGSALFLILGVAALGGGLFILPTESPANHPPAQFQAKAEESKPADSPDATALQPPGLRMTIEDKQGAITSLAFCRNGNYLASGSYDNIVKLWDVKTGRRRASLKGHTNAVLCLACSPDGKTLASGSMDRTIKLWDVETGKELATLKGHPSYLHTVAFSPDGKTLASASDGEHTIKLWDVETGQESATLKGHTNAAYTVAFSPDGKTLASGSRDRTIRLWDVKTGKERAILKEFTGGGSVVYSPDGNTLASGGSNTVGTWAAGERNALNFWDVKTGQKSAGFVETGDVDSVAYSPDGKTLVLGGFTTTLWNVATGTELFSFDSNHQPTYALAYSPDGKTLASTGKDGTIKLWDVQTLKIRNAVKLPDAAVNETVTGQLKPPGATFSAVAGPGWLKINPDGSFSGKPEEIDSGVNTWVISVTKGNGAPTFIELQIRVIGSSIIVENFNRYRGDQNAIQWQSGQKVAHSGRVTGWTGTGENSMHTVDRNNRSDQTNPRNWAVMIFQDNVITSGAFAANSSGQVYRIDFEASPAVYANPQQATRAGDELLIEVLLGDDRVLAGHKHSPGAWTGTPKFAAGSFQYTGDGSGDVRLRIKPAGPQNSGRFHGAIDNIIVRKDEAKK